MPLDPINFDFDHLVRDAVTKEMELDDNDRGILSGPCNPARFITVLTTTSALVTLLISNEKGAPLVVPTLEGNEVAWMYSFVEQGRR